MLTTEPAAVLKARGKGGQNFGALCIVELVMINQYRLWFADDAAAEKMVAVLRKLELGEEIVF